MNFLKTFRVRLLIILAILLIATLGVQYYLNLQTERQNEQLREVEQQALVESVALVLSSFNSADRIGDLIIRPDQQFFGEKTKDRIRNIIIINEKWEVYDSRDEKYLPQEIEKDVFQKVKLENINDLPTIVNSARLGKDAQRFPINSKILDTQAYVIPFETSDQGRWHIIVILKNDKGAAFQKAAQPLIYTLAILSISTLITLLLVWRFTRPIAQLSDAAKRIAEGDLSVRVNDENRTDELGQLAARFNEMTAELEKKEELEDKIQEIEKSAVVGRLASAIAHEIRNPLNYINLTLDQLRAKFVPEDEQKAVIFDKLTSQLKTEVGRINQQISDFLRYSKPLKLNLQPTNLREVINNSLNIVEGQAEEQGVKISVIEHENAAKVLADAEVLRSVFNNLFINAVQAMPTGGNLNVTISPDDNFAKIEITDTGSGISPENLPKIFEPYFSTKETGTGLGLAIVKRIIDEHSGTISAESHLNEGTKFKVKLPKSEIR